MNRSLLREFVSLILREAKVDKLIEENPEFADSLQDVNDISPKYLDWSLKQLKQGANKLDLVPTLQFFHKNNQRISGSKDINSYKTLKELENVVKSTPEASKTKQRDRLKAEGVDKMYEDDQHVLLYVKNKDAAVCYGSGTKWCITMKDASYYEEYSDSNVVFYYLINKTLPKEDPRSKIAFAIQRDENNNVIKAEIFDAYDDKISEDADNKRFVDISLNDAPKRPMNLFFKIENKKASEQEIISAMNDSNPKIRIKIAKHIDPKYLPEMMNDESADVRYHVAGRIDPSYLPEMMHDKDVNVRIQVSRRIDPEYLPKLVDIKDPGVRYYVSQRIDPSFLPEMMNDDYVGTRVNVARRIDPEYLPRMMHDSYRLVRVEVAKRIDPEYLPEMTQDNDDEVREIAIDRL